jgi:hypothetical protein
MPDSNPSPPPPPPPPPLSLSLSLWFVQPTFGLWREVTFVDIVVVVVVPREELQGAGTLVRYVGRVSSLPNFYGADALTASQVPRLLLFPQALVLALPIQINPVLALCIHTNLVLQCIQINVV